MKHSILSAPAADWLENTMIRNRARFGGFTMKLDDSGGESGDSGGEAGAAGETSDETSGGAGSEGGAPGSKGKDATDYPENTPVAQMTVEQQAAYWRAMARKHEDTWKSVKDKNLTPDQVIEMQARLDEFERNQLTDHEREVADAKVAGRDEAAKEFGPKSVRTAFNLLLGDMPEQERNDQIDLLDLSKFLTDAGDVDTDKVRALASRIAPTGTGQGTNHRHDFGGGSRGQSARPSGVNAGQAMFEASRGKSTSNS